MEHKFSILLLLLMFLMIFASNVQPGLIAAQLTQVATATVQPPVVHELEFTEPKEGQPAIPKGWTNIKQVPWKEIPSSLTDDLEKQIYQEALQDTHVRELLGERFAYISTDPIELLKHQPQSWDQPLRTLVTFFSYSNNVAIEVHMKGLIVEDARRKERYYPPEGNDEIMEAVAMARSDQRLIGKLEGLDGNAIAISPQSGHPGYGHRVLDVMFARIEGVALYHAVVDLTDRKILAAGLVKNQDEYPDIFVVP